MSAHKRELPLTFAFAFMKMRPFAFRVLTNLPRSGRPLEPGSVHRARPLRAKNSLPTGARFAFQDASLRASEVLRQGSTPAQRHFHEPAFGAMHRASIYLQLLFNRQAAVGT